VFTSIDFQPVGIVHFSAEQFDVIISRQLVNGLFDPLTAFSNWLFWLKPGGTVIAIDGLYGRSAWTGNFEEEVDLLPLSACQSMATLPYLLEKTGFEIEAVNLTTATNTMPATRTMRYVVVARKVGAGCTGADLATPASV